MKGPRAPLFLRTVVGAGRRPVTVRASVRPHRKTDVWTARTKQALLVVVGAAVAYNGYAVAARPDRISETYGVVADGPDLQLLLRHRAVLLALVGSLLVASAFRTSIRPAAVVTAGTSIATYAAFALTADVNDDLRLVGYLDVGLLAALTAAVLIPDPRPRVA